MEKGLTFYSSHPEPSVGSGVMIDDVSYPVGDNVTSGTSLSDSVSLSQLCAPPMLHPLLTGVVNRRDDGVPLVSARVLSGMCVQYCTRPAKLLSGCCMNVACVVYRTSTYTQTNVECFQFGFTLVAIPITHDHPISFPCLSPSRRLTSRPAS